jgi:hypothetical protein
MRIYQVVVLAFFQAFTKFLPISSTAPWCWHRGSLAGGMTPGSRSTVALHADTLAAIHGLRPALIAVAGGREKLSKGHWMSSGLRSSLLRDDDLFLGYKIDFAADEGCAIVAQPLGGRRS